MWLWRLNPSSTWRRPGWAKLGKAGQSWAKLGKAGQKVTPETGFIRLHPASCGFMWVHRFYGAFGAVPLGLRKEWSEWVEDRLGYNGYLGFMMFMPNFLCRKSKPKRRECHCQLFPYPAGFRVAQRVRSCDTSSACIARDFHFLFNLSNVVNTINDS